MLTGENIETYCE